MENYLLRHKDGGYLYKVGMKWARTSNASQADRMTREKALNILHNCIGPSARECWEVVSEGAVEFANTPSAQLCSGGPGGFDWERLSETQCDLYKRLTQYGEYLRRQLSNVDLEICDIQHYIEFFSLDAAKGYKAYRMLKERLERRRNIKDEMAKVNCFLSSGSKDFSTGKVVSQLQGLDNCRYTPRVLSELFELDAPEKKMWCTS